eukprot:1498808-Ditylum_brightwellii.AAC.1
MILVPSEILKQGLQYVTGGKLPKTRIAQRILFWEYFGSPSLVFEVIWSNLITTEIPAARLTKEDKTMKGFNMFMMAFLFFGITPRKEACYKVGSRCASLIVVEIIFGNGLIRLPL